MRDTEHLRWWSPQPRADQASYDDWNYGADSVDYLPVPDVSDDPGVFSVIESRRSAPPVGSLRECELSALLWFTAKVRSAVTPEVGGWQHRPVPSAGGRHPIDILVSNWPPGADSLLRYDPVAHALWRLRVHSAQSVKRLIDAAAVVSGNRGGAVLWHAAQFARTTSKYESGDSLVWRDAGALVGITTVVAEALGLACCPLGLTGDPLLADALGADSRVCGVGGCVVGSRQ